MLRSSPGASPITGQVRLVRPHCGCPRTRSQYHSNGGGPGCIWTVPVLARPTIAARCPNSRVRKRRGSPMPRASSKCRYTASSQPWVSGEGAPPLDAVGDRAHSSFDGGGPDGYASRRADRSQVLFAAGPLRCGLVPRLASASSLPRRLNTPPAALGLATGFAARPLDGRAGGPPLSRVTLTCSSQTGLLGAATLLTWQNAASVAGGPS